MNEQWSPEERALSSALHETADQVQPGPDGLARIRRRTASGVPWWRSPAVLGVAGGIATATAVVAIAVNVMGPGESETSVQPATTPEVTETDEGTATEPPPSEEPSPEQDDPTSEPTDAPGDHEDPSAEPTEAADETGQPPGDDSADADVTAMPVYFEVAERLTREWQSPPADRDVLFSAVDYSLNAEALDPRYDSLWAPVEVNSVQVVDDVIEVDLRSPVELAAGSSLADEAVQQLVYTATAAASVAREDVDGALPVQLLVDGTPPDTLFGELDATEPFTRAAQEDVRHLVQIDSPAYGEEVTAPVNVTGVAAVFEATVLWELRRDGEVVDSGHTMTEEAFTFSPYHFAFDDLEPGTYEISLMEDDPSGGEGREPYVETKRFTVVEP
ncbi:hypothetical protein EF847_16635 [Actinobacteria bacterium YIM 96077]|uniref:GerMN domain-containing protein n=1 Tax=Phytoactinopolyspora halophila TaxID=1981511 RepID=A0A329QGY3_9ACTN|nr:Gmad2 immunoglobulin-like domain-containing protein [Phytoactinopolyspora halophila]AYY14082.1 hypothetical protein EF847_16635 [Actinobacteria bacterium YIM 96077]RAW10989.1 hypothetical protein DPM12_17970 [Phytoactinopolyspora halophila]